MEENRIDASPSTAAARLDELSRLTETPPQEHRPYAYGTMLMGPLVGIMFVASRRLESNVSNGVGLAAVGVMALAQWKVRATTKVVPRHFGRRVAIGFGASMFVALVVVLPMLNTQGADGTSASLIMLVTGCVAIALPSCLAALAMLNRP